MTQKEILEAARVPVSVPSGTFGRWRITRQFAVSPDDKCRVGWDSFTVLLRYPDSGCRTVFDIVMEDSRQELKRHWPIWKIAKGRVLISGLGLGCVVRGLLANPAIQHVDVVEIDLMILQRIGQEFENNPRVSLHHGDALTYRWPTTATWDYAWHDLWCQEGKRLDSKLQYLHVNLLLRFQDRVRAQGAWAFPQELKRMIPNVL